MPFRYNYRRRIRRRRIPYAIPPQEIVRKFALVLPARRINDAGQVHYLQLNHPVKPNPSLGTYVSGTQPAGLDFWIGNSSVDGPYQSGVVTWVKVHHTIWSTDSNSHIIVNYVDNSTTYTTPTTPNIAQTRPGTKSVIINNNDDQKPVVFKRRVDLLREYGLTSVGDAFESANYLFARTTAPTTFVYDVLKAGDALTNTWHNYAQDASPLFVVTKLTFWIHLRMKRDNRFDDGA